MTTPQIIKLPSATVRELPSGWLRKETGRTYKTAASANRAIRREAKQIVRNNSNSAVIQPITWEPTTRAGIAVARVLSEQ